MSDTEDINESTNSVKDKIDLDNLPEDLDPEILLDAIIESILEELDDVINSPTATPEEKERARILKEFIKIVKENPEIKQAIIEDFERKRREKNNIIGVLLDPSLSLEEKAKRIGGIGSGALIQQVKIVALQYLQVQVRKEEEFQKKERLKEKIFKNGILNVTLPGINSIIKLKGLIKKIKDNIKKKKEQEQKKQKEEENKKQKIEEKAKEKKEEIKKEEKKQEEKKEEIKKEEIKKVEIKKEEKKKELTEKEKKQKLELEKKREEEKKRNIEALKKIEELNKKKELEEKKKKEQEQKKKQEEQKKQSPEEEKKKKIEELKKKLKELGLSNITINESDLTAINTIIQQTQQQNNNQNQNNGMSV